MQDKKYTIIFFIVALGVVAACLLLAILPSGGPTRIQITTFAARSTSPSIQKIDCQKPAPAKVLQKQYDATCRLLKSDKQLPWGDHSCNQKPGTNQTPLVQINGIVKGDEVSGTYQMGPCAPALAAWVQVSPLWSQPVASKIPARVLVLLPDKFRDPGTWPERKRWLKRIQQVRVMPQCTQSLPNLDLQVCLIPKMYDRETQITVKLSVAQLYGLIKASPRRVLQIIDQAKRVPPPPGYPGYEPPSGQ